MKTLRKAKRLGYEVESLNQIDRAEFTEESGDGIEYFFYPHEILSKLGYNRLHNSVSKIWRNAYRENDFWVLVLTYK
jgi:hypothetical protein